MSTLTKEPRAQTEQHPPQEVAQTAEKGVKSLHAFWTKFSNDWVMNFASSLAFNLITAIFPIVIAIISIVGFVIGALDPLVKTKLINSIQNVFPQPISSGHILGPALNSLSKNAGSLGTIAVLVAIFGGSRLFIAIENYFDIIYRTLPRDVIKQNLMALGMLLLFIVLIPLMVFVSFIPALVQSLLKATLISQIPGNDFIFALVGILFGLIVTWILFEAIYIVVPNQHISFRHSWLGALVAAVAIQIYLTLFPFYATHFLGSYTGVAGFAVILLLFFYYFAVILLVGAEINSFFAEGIRATPHNLAVMVHLLTSTTQMDIQEQAPPSHKQEEPKDILPKSKVNSLEAQATRADQSDTIQAQPDSSTTNHKDRRAEKRKASSRGPSGALTIAEVVTGTSLAFFVQLFRLRRKK